MKDFARVLSIAIPALLFAFFLIVNESIRKPILYIFLGALGILVFFVIISFYFWLWEEK